MHPYRSLPEHHFWKTGVAQTGVLGYKSLWASKWKLPKNALFATFGSCFAQHISRALMARGGGWFNAEPAPGKTSDVLARKYNYGVFSARTGNIYTAAQLLAWVRLAQGATAPEEVEFIKTSHGRYYDALRGQIEPNGFASSAEVRASLKSTVNAFRRCISEASVFVFTLGLTEGWENSETGQCYSVCPGTQVGTFDPDQHVFKNYTFVEIFNDLELAIKIMRDINPDIQILLTVSPVPLVATASGKHVLTATQYSKSVLRAVAGQFEMEKPFVDYFPSYEIIAAPPSRAMFFEPDMRSVAPQGVAYVMEHFFAGLNMSGDMLDRDDASEAFKSAAIAEMEQQDLVCEEKLLEQFNAAG